MCDITDGDHTARHCIASRTEYAYSMLSAMDHRLYRQCGQGLAAKPEVEPPANSRLCEPGDDVVDVIQPWFA
ncbi:hypothetical protein VI03_22980 [Burkholderia vietnamiensis]|nr:hypothetical protein VI03_22980 [Burkholderia vietnamiensis]KVR66740.1 hypothetical protein WK24_17185 [Burkholderia vietnamiensis]